MSVLFAFRLQLLPVLWRPLAVRGHPGTPGQVAAHAGDVAGLDGSVVGHHGARPVAHLSGRGVGVTTGGEVVPTNIITSKYLTLCEVAQPVKPGDRPDLTFIFIIM